MLKSNTIGISVIIPVFNGEKTIARCLNSILENNFSNLEIILINDGSTDKSDAEIQKFLIRKNVKLFNQKNIGVALTRNKGIKLAKKNYVMFVDQDDFVDSDYFATFFNNIYKTKYDMVIGGYKRVNDKKTLYKSIPNTKSFGKYLIMAPWAKIYKKSFLKNENIEFLDNSIGEDVYFNLSCLSLTNKINVSSYAGYNWFYNDKSVSNHLQKKNNLTDNVIFLLDSMKAKLIDNGDSLLEYFYFRYIVWYILFSKTGIMDAKRLFHWMKKNYPLFYNNKHISIFSDDGDDKKNKIAMSFFIFIIKLRLI